ncbi:MAG TPA: signal peptidase I, partial [Planctomycetaceae bacterium]|nr:signal peptidase I [Planctomycetaceae bacterium]
MSPGDQLRQTRAVPEWARVSAPTDSPFRWALWEGRSARRWGTPRDWPAPLAGGTTCRPVRSSRTKILKKSPSNNPCWDAIPPAGSFSATPHAGTAKVLEISSTVDNVERTEMTVSDTFSPVRQKPLDKTAGHRPVTDNAATGNAEGQAIGVRHLMDFLVCLALWVVLVRGFGIEGYIISTGSMAPHLLGYHKRVVCPSCQMVFAVGISPGSMPGELRRATCPNCGQSRIDISEVPVNAGDQLLVHKNAYAFRRPRRWDMVVFRNPEDPTQAYVKRVVGLPGERVQIVAGEVVIDGHIQRKTLMQQRATRVLVYDDTHRPPPASDWRPRWTPDSGWRSVAGG